jgi:PPOX class probable F420-dependent enzyme
VAALNDDARRLLAGPNYGYLATLMPGGHPKVDPVWVHHEDDLVLVTTDGRSIKATNVALDDRVGLAVTAFDDPYDQLQVRGHVVELRPDDDLAVLDAMSEKYLGEPFPRRRWSQRLVLVIRPTLARATTSPLTHRPKEHR